MSGEAKMDWRFNQLFWTPNHSSMTSLTSCVQLSESIALILSSKCFLYGRELHGLSGHDVLIEQCQSSSSTSFTTYVPVDL